MVRRSEKDLSPLGAYLDDARIVLGMSVTHVAEAASVSRQCWYAIVYGDYLPRQETLARLVQVLQLNLPMALQLRSSVYVPSRLELTSLSDQALHRIITAANIELARRRRGVAVDHG